MQKGLCSLSTVCRIPKPTTPKGYCISIIAYSEGENKKEEM